MLKIEKKSIKEPEVSNKNEVEIKKSKLIRKKKKKNHESSSSDY